MTALAENHHDPEPRTGLALVSANGLPDLTRVEREVERFKAQADLSALRSIQTMADAYSALFAERNASKTVMDGLGRIKLLAEAALGHLDLLEYPTCLSGNREKSRSYALIIGGRKIEGPIRGHWRELAIADARGFLHLFIEKLSSDIAASVTTERAVALARAQGTYWTPTEPLEVAFRRSGMTLCELGERLPDHPDFRQATIGSRNQRLGVRLGIHSTADSGVTKRRATSIAWASARPIAEALGLDPFQLECIHRGHDLEREREQRAAAREALERHESQRRARALRKRGNRTLDKVLTGLLRCIEELDDAQADLDRDDEMRAELDTVQQRLYAAEDALRHALKIAYDKSLDGS